ncbi:LacI family DNA-binding transcriptional regulator [uncultured Corynebacterium sp.]|uniref:LacI family DNA-binding transcriptional regulator n=1 Tax=uncultured Corynebacterium sp. TaxID=159447 RepID=UPI0025E1021F|nr:LacI family DNA-binding transcriptional regulator [uncultured Corynebacterium sp.]
MATDDTGAQTAGETTDDPAAADPTVTIYDVAERAGVAPSTVSRTFSRPDRVSSRTADKVLAAARELGYKLVSEVRPGKRGPRARSNILGLVIADVSNPFFHEIMRGADHAAVVHGMAVAAVNANESSRRGREAAEHLIPAVDGMLLASARLTEGEIRKIARTTPTVVCNRPVPGVPSVLVDNHDGALRAVLHLATIGCKSITYLAGPEGAWADGMRWRGILDAVGSVTADNPQRTTSARRIRPSDAQYELMRSVPVHLQRLNEPSIRGGARAFEVWRKNPTDGVICYNDLAAAGFVRQARANGVDVPGDVAVIGFDNTELTIMVDPPLTTVAAPLRTVGRVAAANLISLIQGADVPLDRPRLLPTRLIVRGSTSGFGANRASD